MTSEKRGAEVIRLGGGWPMTGAERVELRKLLQAWRNAPRESRLTELLAVEGFVELLERRRAKEARER
jgi:hypothetical protein